MEDLVKRECITTLVNRGLEESAAVLSQLGVASAPIDEIDKVVMINKMMEVCDSSGKEIAFCEEFLQSDIYIRYSESIKKMTGVIFEKMDEILTEKTKH